MLRVRSMVLFGWSVFTTLEVELEIGVGHYAEKKNVVSSN